MESRSQTSRDRRTEGGMRLSQDKSYPMYHTIADSQRFFLCIFHTPPHPIGCPSRGTWQAMSCLRFDYDVVNKMCCGLRCQQFQRLQEIFQHGRYFGEIG